jgi:hypothetical protein
VKKVENEREELVKKRKKETRRQKNFVANTTNRNRGGMNF